MISAWRRLINRDPGADGSRAQNGTQEMPPGIQKLDKELQRKFARGVNYNMKVLIKGDARVGKTSLFLRLKGYGFEDDYAPTENLNVTSINWNYNTTDDVVKIDLWEAIDQSSSKNINYVDLKLDNVKLDQPNNGDEKSGATESAKGAVSARTTITSVPLKKGACDLGSIPESAKKSLAQLSETIDVYKGTDAVLLVMDMTKPWTFKYIQAELPKVPKHIPILIISNYRDQGHHRKVSAEQVKAFIDGLDRSPCDGTVMYTETSMKNGFGLKLVEKFLNIPFLKLQESSFLKQLELNRCEFMSTLEELQLMQESTSREYEQYLELQTIRRRQQADALSPVNLGVKNLDEATREQIRNATVSSDEIDKNKNAKSIESNNNNDKSEAQVMASQNFVNNRLTSIVMGAKCPLPGTKSSQIQNTSQQDTSHLDTDRSNKLITDEFSDDSDEDEPKANPLVANYQSDLDSDDQIKSDPKK